MAVSEKPQCTTSGTRGSERVNFIEKNDLLCENQLGFQKNFSTRFAINSIYNKFINKIYIHAVCFWINQRPLIRLIMTFF